MEGYSRRDYSNFNILRLIEPLNHCRPDLLSQETPRTQTDFGCHRKGHAAFGVKTCQTNRPALDKKPHRRYRTSHYCGRPCCHTVSTRISLRIVWILLSCINLFCSWHLPPHPRPAAAKNRKTIPNPKHCTGLKNKKITKIPIFFLQNQT